MQSSDGQSKDGYKLSYTLRSDWVTEDLNAGTKDLKSGKESIPITISSSKMKEIFAKQSELDAVLTMDVTKVGNTEKTATNDLKASVAPRNMKIVKCSSVKKVDGGDDIGKDGGSDEE